MSLWHTKSHWQIRHTLHRLPTGEWYVHVSLYSSHMLSEYIWHGSILVSVILQSDMIPLDHCDLLRACVCVGLNGMLCVLCWCVQNNPVTARSCMFDSTVPAVPGRLMPVCWTQQRWRRELLSADTSRSLSGRHTADGYTRHITGQIVIDGKVLSM